MEKSSTPTHETSSPSRGSLWRCSVALALLVFGFWWQQKDLPRGAAPDWKQAQSTARQSWVSHEELLRSSEEAFIPPGLDATIAKKDDRSPELRFDDDVTLWEDEDCKVQEHEALGWYEHFCKEKYDADAFSGKVLGILNISHAELKTDVELRDIKLGKLEARGSKVSMLSIKEGTEIIEVVVGNATIDTLELEADVRIGKLEISGSSLKSLELRNAVVRQLVLRNSSIDAISLELSTVEQLEMESVSAKGSLAIQGSAVGDIDIKSATFHEIEVRLDDRKLREPQVDTWKMRGVQAASIKVDSANVGTIEFDDVKATGRLKVEGAHVDKLNINASTLGRLELDAKKSSSRRQTTVHKLKLDRTQVGVWEVADKTVVANATLTESKLEAAELRSEGFLDVDFKNSTVKRLGLDKETWALWKGGDISTFSGDVEVVKAVLWLAPQGELNRQAWTAFEKQLRDEGSNRVANALHVVRLKDEWRRTKWSALGVFEAPLLWVRAHLTLDAHGDPITYVAWLFSVVFFAAGVVFTNPKNGKEPPGWVLADPPPPPPPPRRSFKLTGSDGVKYEGGWVENGAAEPKDPNKAADVASAPAAPKDEKKSYAEWLRGFWAGDTRYSPFIMSLATLVPGDTFNYLRNFKFVPKHRAQALLVIALQLLALTLQGLLIASIALLIGK